MDELTVTQVRKDLYNIVKAKKPIEIKHREGSMVLIPKEEYKKMELELLGLEMDRIVKSNEPILSAKEVEKMIARVLKDA